MQLKHLIGGVAFGAGLSAACVSACGAQGFADEQNAGVLLRYFADSDKVTVRSSIGDYALTLRNNTAFTLHWNNERVVIPGVAAPAGSQEAVDAITTASRPISGNAYEAFIKSRNEFQGNVATGGVEASYYFSTESDYLAQQIGGSYNRDLLDQRLNLSAGTSYGWDEITPLADDDTNTGSDRKTTLHWNAVATQVVSPTTLVRVGLEQNIVNGLQHNPYRNVYAGGGNVAERHPDHRKRSDAFVKVNQFLPNQSSLKLHYRYYTDDWGVDSHEVGTKLSQYITRGIFARYRYRWYSQTPANFYRDDYTDPNGVGGFQTGDYRLGDLSAHLFGFALNFDLDALAIDRPFLRHTTMWVDYERYFNSNNYSSDSFATGLAYRF